RSPSIARSRMRSARWTRPRRSPARAPSGPMRRSRTCFATCACRRYMRTWTNPPQPWASTTSARNTTRPRACSVRHRPHSEEHMNFEFTPKQREIYELAGTLAREKFAPRAAMYDVEARSPVENLQDLRENGLLKLTVSED